MRGEHVGSQEHKQLVRVLEEAPHIIKRLMSDLRDSKVRVRSPEKGWSPLEYICHLRDIEQEGYIIRLIKMLTEDQPFLEDIDGDKLAVERAYVNQDFDQALEAFINARAVNVEVIRDLSADDLSKSGIFENIGPITFLELLTKMSEHDQGHINELIQLRDQIHARRATQIG